MKKYVPNQNELRRLEPKIAQFSSGQIL